MENGEQRYFHIRNESKETLAKITVIKEFDKYAGVIFVNAQPTAVEYEVFNHDNELNRTIRTLIFKASLADFMDIKERDAKGNKIK